ncbi:MAG: hypothetical protein E6H68_17085 [Betaproteobacteria bacterium]|nr:MAG: hypothetical protein E6H68_17085 [Betaproteobacteria bacterium]
MLRTTGNAWREFPFAAAVPTLSSRDGETSTGMMGVATLPGERMTSFGGEASLEVCAVAIAAAPNAQASKLSLIFDFIIAPFANCS